MTKAELIEALKNYPDDMKVCLELYGGLDELRAIEPLHREYWKSNHLTLDDEYINENVILLTGDTPDNEKDLAETLRQQNEKLALHMSFVNMYNLESEFDAFDRAIDYRERMIKMLNDKENND